MTQTHPITPPLGLVEQWFNDSPIDRGLTLATQAAQWGADMELEACCEWLRKDDDAYQLVGLRAVYLDHELHAARRPKPPSLKEQALTALHAVATGANDTREQHQDLDTIRRALEALND